MRRVERKWVAALRVSLFLAYVFALAMSSAHLSSWYTLSLGELPKLTAWGLALSLELTAFLLSVASSRFGESLPTARYGAYGALALVWAGNYLAMTRSAVGLPLWEVFLQSLFVPVATLLAGKTIGDLYRMDAEAEGRGDPYPTPLPSSSFEGAVPDTSILLPLLQAFPNGATLEELSLYLPMPQGEIESSLKRLRSSGVVVCEGERWFLSPSARERTLQ